VFLFGILVCYSYNLKMKLSRYVVILIDRLSWILTCLDKIGSLSSSTLLRHPTDVPIKNKINKIVLFNISNHFSWLDLTKPELNFNDRRLNFRTNTLEHLFRVMWLRWTLKKTSGRNEQLERTNEVSADKVLSVLKKMYLLAQPLHDNLYLLLICLCNLSYAFE
jgi:hypothetical protein